MKYYDGGDKISADEVSRLLSEQKTPLVPPTTYIPIWVSMNPAEKIDKAKEELKDVGASGDCEAYKSKTSGKDTDSNGKKIDDVVTEAKLEASKPLLDTVTGLTPALLWLQQSCLNTKPIKLMGFMTP